MSSQKSTTKENVFLISRLNIKNMNIYKKIMIPGQHKNTSIKLAITDDSTGLSVLF
jgi:hypothetical protein